MSLSKHRVIAGSLLCAFAILNFWVCVVMIEKVAEIPRPTEPFPPLTIILLIVPFVVYVMMIFCVIQFVAGFRMAIPSIRLGVIDLTGCFAAILGGWSLPVGIYAAWVLRKSKDAVPSLSE